MLIDATLPERIERVIGSLPEAGCVLDPSSYPFETMKPSSDGFIEREGVRTYYAVWGETEDKPQAETIVFAPVYQVVDMRLFKGTVPYLTCDSQELI